MTGRALSGPAGLRALAAAVRCPHPRRGWRRFPLVARPDGVPVYCGLCERWGVVYPRKGQGA